jgi:hypothetical protein
MRAALRNAYDSEIREAGRFASTGAYEAAFAHLERAHVLGQRDTRAHVRAHWAMFSLAWRRRNFVELRGQAGRIVGAALFTWIWVPDGNTGGANVSALKRMEIPPDLRRLLDEERID